jgi:hypothetical protein
MIGYDIPSETARLSVPNDSLTNWMELKIQSILVRNLQESNETTRRRKDVNLASV